MLYSYTPGYSIYKMQQVPTFQDIDFESAWDPHSIVKAGNCHDCCYIHTWTELVTIVLWPGFIFT